MIKVINYYYHKIDFWFQAGAVEEETTLTEDNSEQPDTTLMNIPQTPSALVSRPTKNKLNPFEQASLKTMQR